MWSTSCALHAVHNSDAMRHTFRAESHSNPNKLAARIYDEESRAIVACVSQDEQKWDEHHRLH